MIYAAREGHTGDLFLFYFFMLICYHIYIYTMIEKLRAMSVRAYYLEELLFRFHSIIIFCMYIILLVNYTITVILVLCIHANL
jgi:hypothetical protein